MKKYTIRGSALIAYWMIIIVILVGCGNSNVSGSGKERIGLKEIILEFERGYDKAINQQEKVDRTERFKNNMKDFLMNLDNFSKDIYCELNEIDEIEIYPIKYNSINIITCRFTEDLKNSNESVSFIHYIDGEKIDLNELSGRYMSYEFYEDKERLILLCKDESAVSVIDYSLNDGLIKKKSYKVKINPDEYFVQLLKTTEDDLLDFDTIMCMESKVDLKDIKFLRISEEGIEKLDFSKENLSVKDKLEELIFYRREFDEVLQEYKGASSSEKYELVERAYIDFKEKLWDFLKKEDIFNIQPFLLDVYLGKVYVDIDQNHRQKVAVISLNDRYEMVMSNQDSKVSSNTYLTYQYKSKKILKPLSSFGCKDMRIYEHEENRYAVIISQNSWYGFIRIIELNDKDDEGVELIDNIGVLKEEFYDVEFLKEKVYRVGFKKGSISFDEDDNIILNNGNGANVRTVFIDGKFYLERVKDL